MLRTYWLISIILMIIPSFLAVLYGVIFILPKRKEIYEIMGVCAVFCMFIAQLADYVVYISGHNVDSSFHIGSLGTVGYLLFLLTANMGPETITDSEGKLIKKRPFLAVIPPVLTVFIYIAGTLVLTYVYNDDSVIIPRLIMTLITVVSLYFCSQIIFASAPKNSFTYCLRPYNIAVTFVGILLSAERGMRDLWIVGEGHILQNTLMISMYITLGLALFVSVILLKRGTDRWLKT